jgi:hypothetical protein
MGATAPAVKLPMFNRSMREVSLQFVASGSDVDEISRGGILHTLFLKIEGQLTCTNANNTRANTVRGDVANLIRRLRIRVNSQENVVDLDGPGLVGDCYTLLGRLPRDVDGQLGDGATANPTFSLTIPVTFTVPRRFHRKPIDTALDCRGNRMSKLEVEVDWNTHTAINTAATGFTVAPTMTVFSQKSYGVPDDQVFGYLRRYRIPHTLSATNSREQVRIATVGSYYGFLINTTDGVADSRAILSGLQLRSGSTIYEDHDPEILSDAYGRVWGDRERPFSGAAFGYLAPMISTGFDLRAWLPLIVAYDGNLQEILPAAGLPELIFEFNATVGGGTTVINVYPYQYEQPPMR